MKELDSKSIHEVEEEALSYQSNYVESRKNFIKILLYIEKNKRWHENPQFKKAPFADYLKDKFSISYQQYYYERVAIEKFADKIEDYDYGTAIQVVRRVPANKREKTFKLLDKKRQEKLDDSIHTSEIEKAIKSIAPKKKKKKKKKKKAQPKPSEMTKVDLEKEITKLRDQLRLAGEENSELQDQVKKLKNTVANRDKVIAEKDQYIEELESLLKEKNLTVTNVEGQKEGYSWLDVPFFDTRRSGAEVCE